MAAGTRRPNLQTGAARRHSLHRKVSDRWAHFCPSRKPVAEITMTIISTAPVIRITLRLWSASGPTLFTKMCGPRKATAPKQMKVKKGNKPVGILIMGNAANSMFGPKSPAERAAPRDSLISWGNYERAGGCCQHVNSVRTPGKRRH